MEIDPVMAPTFFRGVGGIIVTVTLVVYFWRTVRWPWQRYPERPRHPEDFAE